MKKVDLSKIDINEALFHFDVRDVNLIESQGLLPDIGPDSINAETNPKVFFSKGVDGVLKLIDVWIVWKMNNLFCRESTWVDEFLSKRYLLDNNKKDIVFEFMYDWLNKRHYYILNLIENKDYFNYDIDEAKNSVLANKNNQPLRYLFACEMYDSLIIDNKVEYWNMHTCINKVVESSKIFLVECDGKTKALDVLISLYNLRKKDNKYKILDEFMIFVNNKNKMKTR